MKLADIHNRVRICLWLLLSNSNSLCIQPPLPCLLQKVLLKKSLHLLLLQLFSNMSTLGMLKKLLQLLFQLLDDMNSLGMLKM